MLGRPLLGGRRHTVYTDDEGNIYIAGETQSSDFPTGAVEDGKWVNPLQEKFGGGGLDGFAAKLSPTGKLMYSTYLV